MHLISEKEDKDRSRLFEAIAHIAESLLINTKDLDSQFSKLVDEHFFGS